ncbi:MAG: hypothetical protein OEU36_01750 [Gammaproteobacteria bacterium]|nr:hypothetical protein [Gammaproteobacteria bacterium]
MNIIPHGKQEVPGQVENGTKKVTDGKNLIYYDGYWIRYYAPPTDTLAARKKLIDSLTRRTFHHTEQGINTPGDKLDDARRAYEREQDPAKKRVNGAMLAGALCNRAGDIFNTIVNLAEKGVEISVDDALMRQCGEYFKEALALGKMVKHRSGCEGIDELWGEPLKAFTMPIAAFYESRYIKIAQTMCAIDSIAGKLTSLVEGSRLRDTTVSRIAEYAESAKLVSETIKRDPVIFDVWPRFIAARERFSDIESLSGLHGGQGLLREGKELIAYVAGARVPMPKSTKEFLAKCDKHIRQVDRTNPQNAVAAAARG